MRTLLVPAAAAAFLATSVLAFAAAQQATGTIKAYNPKAMMLTLADGTTYKLPKHFKNPGLKDGDKVQISYMKSGKGSRTAEQVNLMK